MRKRSQATPQRLRQRPTVQKKQVQPRRKAQTSRVLSQFFPRSQQWSQNRNDDGVNQHIGHNGSKQPHRPVTRPQRSKTKRRLNSPVPATHHRCPLQFRKRSLRHQTNKNESVDMFRHRRRVKRLDRYLSVLLFRPQMRRRPARQCSNASLGGQHPNRARSSLSEANVSRR